ncbi:MAG: TolC family protein [Sphingobacteriales bacterium]|nr:TolC family protein [Sphingobacteriales bacterium]
MKNSLRVLVLLLLSTACYAQEKLTLQQAIELTLQNNFDIQLRSNQVSVAKNNVSLANAGILPLITGNFTNNHSVQNSEQTLANGTQQQQDNAKNANTNVGINLNWRIFDGFAMFANYTRLQKLQTSGELNFRLTVENTLSDVMNTYFDLVRQNQYIHSFLSAVEVSQIRLKNSQTRYSIGKASKLEVLAAKVDLNTDTTNLMRQQDAFQQAKTQLNLLMGRSLETNFTVSDTIALQGTFTYAELLQAVQTKNPEIRLADIQQQVAKLNLTQVRASRYPGISLNTGYNFSNSSSALGFAREATGRGFTYGITASVPLFNGFLQSRNEKNANIGVNSAQIQFKQTQQRIQAQLQQAYQTYTTNLVLVRLETQNQETAKQNMDISLDKFRLGSLSAIEFREAQLNYLNASARTSDAQFQAKQAEIILKQLSGELSVK